MRRSLNEIFSHHTGQPVEKVARDSDRDYFMDAGTAKEYGLVDEVITTLKQPKEAEEETR